MSFTNSAPLPQQQAHPGSPLAAALAGLAALAVAMGIGRFAFTPVLPMMLQDAGIGIAAGGWLASVNYLGYLLGAVGAMALPLPPERTIRLGLVAVGLLTLAMAPAWPFWGWMLLRLLAGIASAWVLISVSAWSLEVLAPHRRPFLQSVVFAGVGSGIAVAGLACLALDTADAGSAAAWTVLGALAMIVTALVWRFFPSPVAAAGAHAGSAGPAVAGSKPLRPDAAAVRMICCYGIYGFGYIIPATFLPVMARDAMQGSAAFGWSWPIFGAAAALSTLAAAALVRRLGNRRVWMLCHLLMAVGCLLPVVATGLAPVFLAALCVGGAFMVVTLVAMQEARQIAGRDAGGLIAAMSAAFATGQILGPLTVSAAGGGKSFAVGLTLAAALLVLSTILLRNSE